MSQNVEGFPLYIATRAFSPAVVTVIEEAEGVEKMPACSRKYLDSANFLIGADFPIPNGRDLVSQPAITCKNNEFSDMPSPSSALTLFMFHTLMVFGVVWTKKQVVSVWACLLARRTSKSVLSPTRTVGLSVAEDTDVFAIRTSASPSA